MGISTETTPHVGGRLPREQFWTIPNSITLGRIAVVPLLLLLPFFPGRGASLVFGVGYLAASLSDLLDGYLARRDGTVTRIGKLLDPLADKLLVMTAFVMLVAVDRLPLWALPLVVAILAREIAVTALRAMASAEGVVLGASSMGKWKAGFQTAAVTALLIYYPLWVLPTYEVGLVLLLVATGLTLWSGYDYLVAHLGADSDADA
ncbi:MAG: CDP-diacylglycerol--glycerol-3-phosphate 3-phosphatidyltransferase [Myxococcales bacterium]|nr:CDP-diacylglycerol--glycerol-3-phosphate 3-phosphatidyltransferase [Myxococcales bacterium]